MLTTDDLLARAEITDVIQRLARGTDRLDQELMASCYHPDGFDDHNSFRGSGTEFAAWVCEVLPHFQATMHFIALPHIRLDGDVAQVDTYCVAHHVAPPDDTGQASDMVLGPALRRPLRAARRHLVDRQAGLCLRLELHDPVRRHRSDSSSPRTSRSASAAATTSPTGACDRAGHPAASRPERVVPAEMTARW